MFNIAFTLLTQICTWPIKNFWLIKKWLECFFVGGKNISGKYKFYARAPSYK
jgi:hypothetical protein